jgi:sortase A
MRRVGASLCLAGLLVGGFVVYLFGLSTVAEQRGQQVMYGAFAAKLSQAVAPFGPTTDGTPVAVLDVPVVLAAAWNVYENAAALLPNLY